MGRSAKLVVVAVLLAVAQASSIRNGRDNKENEIQRVDTSYDESSVAGNEASPSSSLSSLLSGLLGSTPSADSEAGSRGLGKLTPKLFGTSPTSASGARSANYFGYPQPYPSNVGYYDGGNGYSLPEMYNNYGNSARLEAIEKTFNSLVLPYLDAIGPRATSILGMIQQFLDYFSAIAHPGIFGPLFNIASAVGFG